MRYKFLHQHQVHWIHFKLTDKRKYFHCPLFRQWLFHVSWISFRFSSNLSTINVSKYLWLKYIHSIVYNKITYCLHRGEAISAQPMSAAYVMVIFNQAKNKHCLHNVNISFYVNLLPISKMQIVEYFINFSTSSNLSFFNLFTHTYCIFLTKRKT